MRIVGGLFRGRNLASFDGQDVRPTSDKTRESLFNILRDKISGAKFLDLYCGTGAVGIEALSRGAEFVVFNDLKKSSINILEKNLDKIKVQNYKTYNYDATTFLKVNTLSFDIIFMDPPYKSQETEKVESFLMQALSDDGIVIVEGETDMPDNYAGLIKYDTRSYGRAKLSFYKKG